MSTRSAFAFAAAFAAVGLLVWVLLPSRAGGPEGQSATESGTHAPREGLTAGGAPTSGPDAPMKADAAPLPVPAGDQPAAPPSAATAEIARHTLEAARAWLDARRLAREAGDGEPPVLARDVWDLARKALIQRFQRDTAGSVELLRFMGRWDDSEAALELARALPFLWGDGFESHLINSATGKRPLLERRVAMYGLYGRGLRSARAIGRVATEGAETVLRAEATEHLAGHLGDPRVLPARAELSEAVQGNLTHAEASVRRSAISTLTAARNPLPDSVRKTVASLAASDPDERVRALAQYLVRAQQR